MEGFVQLWAFLLLFSVNVAGNLAKPLPYDYSASIECLAEPQKPQYGGGIIRNPEFDHDSRGWHTFSGGEMEARISTKGNRFLISHSRNRSHHSLSQKLYLQKDILYTFSAWVQINEGNAPVSAVFKTGSSSYTRAGTVVARSGCWSMLKGGLTVNASCSAELYFETKNITLEIWVDSVSLQPFTEKQWRTHQAEVTDKVRKRRVRFHAVDSQGNTLPGATISIKQTKSGFPLGCAINQNILFNHDYQNWFASRFSHTTFENEMKWYSTEMNQGREDYSIPDAMLEFTRQHGIAVRGHNIFWDDPTYQQGWIKSLSSDQLRFATEKRTSSIMSRYRGQVIAWDVVNENLHFNFFESKLGRTASERFYLRAHQLDPRTPKFLNEYNTIEEPADPLTTPAKYLHKLNQIRRILGKTGNMAIGLEGHFHTPNLPYMRASLDMLAGAKVPIWITELDVAQDPNQAIYLEQILREAHSHPAVHGIVIWSAWRPEGCYRMCLTDNNFRNLPTGDVVDRMLREWKKSSEIVGMTDGNGFFEAQLFHGDYDVTMNHQSMNSSSVQRFKVAALSPVETALHVTISE